MKTARSERMPREWGAIAAMSLIFVFAAPMPARSASEGRAAGQPSPPGASPTRTPETALAQLVRMPWSQDPFPSRDQIASAKSVLEGALAREPGNARWIFGMGHAARDEVRHLSGQAAVEKRKEAKELLAKAAKLDPSSADFQYWHGNACFEMIDDVGMLSKMSLASEGRKGFEKAIAIDPSNVMAHYALGIYFAEAPTIAGGSTAAATKKGETLLKLPGGKGEYWGHMLLAKIATDEKDWTAMARHYTAAESARGEGASALVALQAQAWALLNTKKDPAAALPVIVRYRTASKPDDTTPDFLEADANRQLGRFADAIPLYEKVLAKRPEARNTRFGIAECYEKIGNRAEAKKHYAEFVRRFPKDDQAGKAREALKRLS